MIRRQECAFIFTMTHRTKSTVRKLESSPSTSPQETLRIGSRRPTEYPRDITGCQSGDQPAQESPLPCLVPDRESDDPGQDSGQGLQAHDL